MLFVIGLERVAEEMMGSKRWKRMTQLENALEQQLQLADWAPDQACYFCDAAATEPAGAPSDDYASFKSFQMELDEQSTGSDQASGSPEPPEEQPLDLSLHAGRTPSEQERPPPLVGRAPVGGKRSYTDAELQAALRDIQSGKLGTRRAAVIYGIPRSTLRNKVYKLALERRSPNPASESLRQLLRAAPQPLEHSPALGPLFAQFLSSIQQLALQPAAGEEPKAGPPPPPLPVVSDLIRLLAQERLADAARSRPAPSEGSIILKVPSYQPAAQRAPSAAASSSCSSSSSSSSEPASAAPPGSSGGAEEKRTRPKRGRYRNYDRDHLIQAVRAVQRGEMSVHRAGTYFGVPHSTLEYKVKERHLLRPKKRRAQDGLLEALIKSTLDK